MVVGTMFEEEFGKNLRRTRLKNSVKCEGRDRCYRDMAKVRKLMEAGKLTQEEGMEAIKGIDRVMRALKSQSVDYTMY